MGTKRVRIANLPPEMKEHAIRTALTPFGTGLSVIEEMRPKKYIYIYKIPNGVRQVTVTLTKHVASQVTVDGHRALLSHEGQPATCYGCGDIGHLYPTCPKRRGLWAVPSRPTTQNIRNSRSTQHIDTPPHTDGERNMSY